MNKYRFTYKGYDVHLYPYEKFNSYGYKICKAGTKDWINNYYLATKGPAGSLTECIKSTIKIILTWIIKKINPEIWYL